MDKKKLAMEEKLAEAKFTQACEASQVGIDEAAEMLKKSSVGLLEETEQLARETRELVRKRISRTKVTVPVLAQEDVTARFAQYKEAASR